MDPLPAPESFFGFIERPFSLTPDPKYYFRSRSHGRAFDALSAGVANRERLLLVAGDLGVGKTTLCKTFIDPLNRKARPVFVGHALLSPEDLLRVLLQDLGAVSAEDVRGGRLAGAGRLGLREMLDEFLLRMSSSAVLIVDEAHNLPAATVEEIGALLDLASKRPEGLQILLAGQASVAGGPASPKALDDRLATRARLLPLERDECETYVLHRLKIAGGTSVSFSSSAYDRLYALSGGVPRLVNLLCERGLEEAANAKSRRVEAHMLESAASGLELLRLRHKRFRWFRARAR